MNTNKKNSRGSVSRSFNYEKKWEDPKFRQKSLDRNKKNEKLRKIKINNRCLDCKKLINPDSIRCKKCSIKYIRKKELENHY